MLKMMTVWDAPASREDRERKKTFLIVDVSRHRHRAKQTKLTRRERESHRPIIPTAHSFSSSSFLFLFFLEQTVRQSWKSPSSWTIYNQCKLEQSSGWLSDSHQLISRQKRSPSTSSSSFSSSSSVVSLTMDSGLQVKSIDIDYSCQSSMFHIIFRSLNLPIQLQRLETSLSWIITIFFNNGRALQDNK